MQIDENGVNPAYQHHGEGGRYQLLKSLNIQGNIGLRQRGQIINNLLDIGEYIQQTNSKLGYVNQNLEYGNEQLEYINKNLEYGNEQLEYVNENLE